MQRETIFTNARVVLSDRVVEGSVVVRGSQITAVDEGNSRLEAAIDLGGDILCPGLIELHTDNLEKHFSPRPGVRWPPEAAVVAHDSQIVAAGITTVFDALAVGDIRADSDRRRDLISMAESVTRAAEAGHLRAEHRLHVRCEVSCETLSDLLTAFTDHPLVGLISMMDHTPGQRQFLEESRYRDYYRDKWAVGDEEIDAFIARQKSLDGRHTDQNRKLVSTVCRERDLPLASHDDALIAHVEEARALGVTIAEFPTTLEAARGARERELHVVAGAPNLVRGESHSGNVAVGDLAAAGLVDILSSDYIPTSLIHAAFRMHQEDTIGLPLHAALATVTRVPACAVGMLDRGEISPGLTADLLWIRQTEDVPLVRGVWRRGIRVG
jgi:alpha-D-ribose 1-methylphosphonate 5-triphosphate diphosphatase